MSIKWNATMQFPTDSNFTNRIIGIDFGPSKSSNNPMLTVTCELYHPQEVEIDGKQVTIAGVETTNYFITENPGDEEKTVASRQRCMDNFWTKVHTPEELENAHKEPNWENIDTKHLLGRLVLTQMEATTQERTKSPTAEQIAKAKANKTKPVGDLMKHPVTGKTLINYWPKINEFFGLAQEQDKMEIAY